MPAHLRERLGRRRPEDVQVPARELEPGVVRIDVRRRHGPDRRQPRAVPADQHRARSARRSAARSRGRRARVPPRRTSSAGRRGRRAAGRRCSSALRRPRSSSGSRPSEKTAWSRAATTYALKRGPQSWTSDGSSQVDGRVPSTRAWIESSAARGMLSCSPAQAARRSDARRAGAARRARRTRRRNARICDRVRSSGAVVIGSILA